MEEVFELSAKAPAAAMMMITTIAIAAIRVLEIARARLDLRLNMVLPRINLPLINYISN